MEITEDLIAHLSKLSKLSFEGQEKEVIKTDLEKMVTLFDKLKEVNTDGVAPLVYLTEEVNVLREDVPEVSITHEEALRNAPKKDSDYFRIPKVIDKTEE